MTPVFALDFISPQRLWLMLAVGVVAAVYVALQWRRRHYAVRFTNVALLDKVAPKRPGWRRHLVAALFIATGALQVVNRRRHIHAYGRRWNQARESAAVIRPASMASPTK